MTFDPGTNARVLTIKASFGTAGSASAQTLAFNDQAILLDQFSYGRQPFWVWDLFLLLG